MNKQSWGDRSNDTKICPQIGGFTPNPRFQFQAGKEESVDSMG